jgi:Sulfotransferase family
MSLLEVVRRRRAKSPHPAPFVVGVSRSGTTLLRLMLDAHPDLAIPAETHFIPKLIRNLKKSDGDPRVVAIETITTHRRWPDFHLEERELSDRIGALKDPSATEILRAFYGLYAERENKSRWGDKSPPYVRKMARIGTILPEARFIHLIRDGRDVALSLTEVEWGPESIPEAAEKWKQWIAKARRQAKRVDHYVELRYEDLVTDPEPALRRVCDFVELEFSEEMLTYHERASERMSEVIREFQIGGGPLLTADDRAQQHKFVSEPPRADRLARWQRDMSEEDQAKFEEIAGDLLAELGYPLAST